ncbi:hypothetical protein TWF569_007170 [Orbilia oligospora]|uniref:NADH:ubiquinone oxidoreductase intermediate-associated protein 30 domain-containing protein n=1 Tax=Orbilia oligospora TaxID=2813651 RepID=A0A7C8NW68_ORBOL|nr:hypothetical protein TWF706_011056 [Orbilia oligospora]KAF3091211.1 hypothetical protein TWF103_011702 [Orbilia oligospora]KAF3106984.1 hypothetical protein TWF102_000828 [Orbilia oligospora]KAF3129254.1 hypothetical protein TWF594_011100 [Orbilia oligospora]KAF3131209.1 hypothetical protein TWF703_007913 [Orbilia oligospora]
MPSSDDSSKNIIHSGKADATLRENTITDLFGGQRKWESEHWTASDDRVRGGRSQSYLKISDDKSTAIFHGDLDITALGGAGFASQRTTGSAGGPWDLSKANGVAIGLGAIDDRIYTLVLKDTILPKRPDGRDQSTISYEFSFSVVGATNDVPSETNCGEPIPLVDLSGRPHALLLPQEADPGEKTEAPMLIVIWIPWDAFHPYYRGKRKPEDGPLDSLDKSKIKRISIMCRSMFGKQFGRFSAHVRSITAFSVPEITSIYSRALLTPLERATGVEDTEDTYIFHRSPSAATKSIPKTDKASEQGLVESLKKLQVEEKQTQTSPSIGIPQQGKSTE